jgi:tetratricopeptide (TPR) repeat protein
MDFAEAMDKTILDAMHAEDNEEGEFHLKLAISMLNNNIEKQENPELYAIRGIAYIGLNEFEKATSDLEKAVEMGEVDRGVHYFLGGSLNEIGRYEDAIKVLTEGLEHINVKEGVLIERCESFRKLRRFEEALNDIDSARRINPKNSVVYAMKGQIMQALDREREAKNYYIFACVIFDAEDSEEYAGVIKAQKGLESLGSECKDYITQAISKRRVCQKDIDRIIKP